MFFDEELEEGDLVDRIKKRDERMLNRSSSLPEELEEINYRVEDPDKILKYSTKDD